ncbi:MAG: hypothetical protein ABR596_03880 [Halarsenatibacteraceae bacterium]
MSSDDSIKFKAFSAFFSAYADLKDQGDITEEQFTQVNEVLEDIENIKYDDLITRLIEIFPEYQPEEFGLFKLND